MLKRYYHDNPEKGSFYHIEGEMKLSTGTVKSKFSEKIFPNVSVGDGSIIGTWSGPELIQIGDKGTVTFNGLGTGTVIGFFLETGYIGLEIMPDKRPDWHVKQCGDKYPTYLVFGAEFKKDTP